MLAKKDQIQNGEIVTNYKGKIHRRTIVSLGYFHNVGRSIDAAHFERHNGNCVRIPDAS